MFKKGSFEVGGLIYPVAIKVRNICLFTSFLCMEASEASSCLSAH